jgi:hypothetical protein
MKATIDVGKSTHDQNDSGDVEKQKSQLVRVATMLQQAEIVAMTLATIHVRSPSTKDSSKACVYR